MSEVPTVVAAARMAETPDRHGAYPRLTDDQIAALEAGGTRRSSAAGETLVHEGKRTDDFFVILSGKVAIIATDETGSRRVIEVHGPRRFLGELGALEGQAAFYTAEVVETGEVLVVPAQLVRTLVAHDPVLSDLILRAYLVRRSLLIEQGTGFRIIGSCWSATNKLRTCGPASDAGSIPGPCSCSSVRCPTRPG
jgi:thioredoxin reductase (NADPH)